MASVAAGDNFQIDMADGGWALRVHPNAPDADAGVVAAEVVAGGLRYGRAFTGRRGLGGGAGTIPGAQVQRVVLGYSPTDEAWHVGLVLHEGGNAITGGRWLGLARWPDPEGDLFEEQARQAAGALAAALGRPLAVKLPPASLSAPQDVPLPTLPLALGGWGARAHKRGWLVLTRDGGWLRGQRLHALWQLVLAALFVVLAFATLRSGLALPRPEVLPYVGLACAAYLLGAALWTLWRVGRQPRRVIADPQTRQLWALHSDGARPLWRLGRADIDGVVVSQRVQALGAASGPVTAAKVRHGELNVRRTDGGYFFLLREDDPAEPLLHGPDAAVAAVPTHEGMVPLGAANAVTPLMRAGVLLADALNVPCWYDARTQR